MLVEGKKIESFLKMIPISLFSQMAKTSKLKKVYLTFDAQNMQTNTNDEIFAGFIQPTKNFIFQYIDNQIINLRDQD